MTPLKLKIKLDNSSNQNIWFTSDTHFYHRNIVSGLSEWESARQFETMELHNEAILSNINNNVKENDILFFLGDFTFGEFKIDKEHYIGNNMVELRNKINCKNVHFILGNHDEPLFNDFNNGGIKYKDLFTSVSRMLDVSIEINEPNTKKRKINLVLCHYPMMSWEGIRNGTIMLYGHCHNTLPCISRDIVSGIKKSGDGNKSMDVGIDANPNLRPFNLKEIMEVMSNITQTTNDYI